MRFISLMAGVGGLDLGLERAGMTCVGQVEIDDYATKVLEKHWPTVPRLRDVREFQGTEFGEFDLLSAGYPCQPFSLAGKRAGEDDERHLWPEVLRVIRNVRPNFVLLENVSGHLSLGFGRVLGDLAESGYDAEWRSFRASDVGAPTRRERVFVVAHTDRSGLEGHRLFEERPGERATWQGVEEQDWEEYPTRCLGMAARVPSRVDRIRGLGNAVVPQVGEFVGRRILEGVL